MKVTYAIISTIIFLIVFFCIYYIHITFLKVNVVFYASLTDALIASLSMGLILLASSRFRLFTQFEKLQLISIWMLLGYSLAISVPTVIDRSLSFYILEKLEQRGGGIKLDSFEDVFINEYLHEHRLVDVRLTEQMESGTIRIDDGCVKLTGKGKVIANVSKVFRRNLLPKNRLLMGDYSDDLINPFKKSTPKVSYYCE